MVMRRSKVTGGLKKTIILKQRREGQMLDTEAVQGEIIYTDTMPEGSNA